MWLRALAKCSLNSGRFGAVTTFLGILFQYPTSLGVKNIFLMSNLCSPWYSFSPCPPVAGHQRQEISTSSPWPWGRCRLWWNHPSAFSSPGSTGQATPAAPHKEEPRGPSPPWSQSNSLISFLYWSKTAQPKTGQGEAASAQKRAGQSPPPWLAGKAQPDAPQGTTLIQMPSTQILQISFQAALHLLVCPCNQDYSVPGGEFITYSC